MDALATDTFHFAKAKWRQERGVMYKASGEYFTGHKVIIARRHKTDFSALIGTVAHEAMHHKYVNAQGDTVGGYSDLTSTIPEDIKNCIDGASEEDDEDDDDDGGGGTTWVPGETCTPGVVYVEVVTSCTDADVVEQGCNPQCTPGLEVCLTTTLVPVVVKCS